MGTLTTPTDGLSASEYAEMCGSVDGFLASIGWALPPLEIEITNSDDTHHRWWNMETGEIRIGKPIAPDKTTSRPT